MNNKNGKRYLYDWRNNFTEAELAEIDAAPHDSIIGRLANELDRFLRVPSNGRGITIDFRKGLNHDQ